MQNKPGEERRLGFHLDFSGKGEGTVFWGFVICLLDCFIFPLWYLVEAAQLLPEGSLFCGSPFPLPEAGESSDNFMFATICESELLRFPSNKFRIQMIKGGQDKVENSTGKNKRRRYLFCSSGCEAFNKSNFPFCIYMSRYKPFV